MIFGNILHRFFFDDNGIDLMRRSRHRRYSVIDKAAAFQRNKIGIVGMANNQCVGAQRIALQHKRRRIGMHTQRQSQRTDRRPVIQHRVVIDTKNRQFFGSRRRGKLLCRDIVCGFIQRHTHRHRLLFATNGIVAVARHEQRCHGAYTRYFTAIFHFATTQM